MVDSGYIAPTGRLVIKGAPANVVYKNLGVAANAYPGRLAVREATDYDVKVSDGLSPVQGWIGYEQQAIQYQVGSITTLNVVDTEVPIINGGGFTIFMPGGLAAGTKVTQDDPLLSWTAGQVIPGGEFGGRFAIKIPFGKSTTEVDTGIDLPAGVNVTGALIDVDTAAASATIDVGILSTESGGDADGFLDGVSCASTGLVPPILSNATAANITLGTLLCDVSKSADTTANYIAAPVNYLTNGTAKSITYTTSNHTIDGNIYIFVESEGVKRVGFSGTTVDASTASSSVFVKATI